jgi:hypothetical protein
MGNEQTQAAAPATPTLSQTSFDYESIILIRGSRKSGKSTLVSRMRGRPFNPTYEPTSTPVSSEIPWKTDSGQNVKLKIWDVAEEYLTANPKRQRDPTVVATLRDATGLVILLDSRSSESIELAENLLAEAPETVQTVVFSNFGDEEGVVPVIPERLQSYIGCFYFIPGSLKTNRGLIELSKWIKLPTTAAKKRMYADKFRAADEALRDLSEKLTATAKGFLTEAIARSHMPELRSKRPPPGEGVGQPVAVGQGEDEMNSKEFWGEASQKKKGPIHKRRRTQQQQQPQQSVVKTEAPPKSPVRRQQQVGDARTDVLPRVDYDTI